MIYAQDVESLLQGSVISKESSSSASLAFDGDPSTYYSASSANFQWIGLDLGRPCVITRIDFMPRGNGSTGADRMLLSLFEGANRPDFLDAVPLYLIGETPKQGSSTSVDVQVSRGFRYVRYVGSAGSYCDVAELAFYGHEGEGDDSHFYQVTCLPTVSIHVVDDAVPEQKGEDFESYITITYEDGTLIQEYPVLTRVRGNFSATHENKPYRIKFNDGKSHHMLHGSARDESPAKAKKWTLINNYGDKTLIRNNVAYEVSRRVGMPFTPWCRCVDVILNGDYRGCYQLTDYVGLDKERINIAEMDDTCTDSVTITGGYLIEMNGYAAQDPVNFTSRHGNPVSVNDPDEKDIQPEQFNYIRNYFNAMEDRVFASSYTDVQTGYRRMLDLDTFLRYVLACEFNGNTDMIWQVFMYKQRSDSLIYTGPVWDNDLALDNDYNVYPGNQRQEWTYRVRTAGNWSALVSRVLSDPNAMAQLQIIWAQLRRDSLFTAQDMGDYVDSLRVLVDESQRLNFIRWPYLTQQLHCNPRVWGTWDAEVDVVRDYVRGRVAWMDRKLNYGSLQQKDGVYQITTPLDLCTFSQIVADGESDAKAELLADLDMTDFSSLFVPMGTEAAPYTGTFDGGGHTIDGLIIDAVSSVALFAYVSGDCVISDLFLGSRSVVRGTDYVGAFVGVVQGGTLVMMRCGSQAMVEASGSNAASLVARVCSGASATLTDCYNVGSVVATSRASSMVAWSEGDLEMQYCYNAGSLRGEEPVCEFAFAEGKFQLDDCYDTFAYQVTHVRKNDVQGGAFCFRLTEGRDDSPWRQNINNVRAQDLHPVPIPSHGWVYKDGSLYTNINPDVTKYRYYKFEVTEIQSGSLIQFAEFDLLDQDLDELPDVQIYAGTESSISHENWYNLADGDLATKYCSDFSGKASFFFDAGNAVDLFGYRIGTANDAASNSGRNPLSWTLSGSNTYTEEAGHASWTLIDKQVGDNPLPAMNLIVCDYLLLHPVTGLSMSSPEVNVLQGENILLSVEVTPRSMGGIPLEWHSSDEQVAMVDASGRVTALSLGQCVITASSPNYCSEVAECKVSVVEELPGYQYFLLAIDGVQKGSTIQFSEFDLLYSDMTEHPSLSMYASTGEYFSNEMPENAVDDDLSTKWCGPFRGTAYLYMDAGMLVRPTAYRIYTAGDSDVYSGRNPSSWRLYASRTCLSTPDDEGWILLDERVDDSSISATRLTPYDFQIDYSQVPDGVGEVCDRPMMDSSAVYDLWGRRWNSVSEAQKAGRIVVSKGRKWVK
ncbi:MAG: CotH kinase family protein [Bacteroidaceae bacterium]